MLVRRAAALEPWDYHRRSARLEAGSRLEWTTPWRPASLRAGQPPTYARAGAGKHGQPGGAGPARPGRDPPPQRRLGKEFSGWCGAVFEVVRVGALRFLLTSQR